MGLGRPSVDRFGGLWFGGCFACNWSRTEAVCPRGAPLVRALQAALKPPSLVKLMQRWCCSACCFWSEVRFCRGGVYFGKSFQSSPLSPSSHRCKRDLVHANRWFLCALPPRGGVHRVHLVSICSSCQDSTVLCQTHAAMALVRQRAHSFRRCFGTCLCVGTYRECMSSKHGNVVGAGARVD